MQTRYGRKLALPSMSGDLFLESPRALRRQFGQAPVLFPTQEASLATLSSAYLEIKDSYRLALPSDELYDQSIARQNAFSGAGGEAWLSGSAKPHFLPEIPKDKRSDSYAFPVC